jgi:hypothetical protein
MIGFFALGAGGATWVAFLLSQDLDDADSWSSVGAMIATVVFGVAGILTGTRGNRGSTPSAASPEQRHGVTQHIVVTNGNAAVQGSGVQVNNFSSYPPPTESS